VNPRNRIPNTPETLADRSSGGIGGRVRGVRDRLETHDKDGGPAVDSQLPPIDACRQLAAAVLAHAVSEALAPPSRDRKRREAQLEARAWLLGETPGLELWAAAAGLDAAAVRSRLAVRLGQRPGVDE